MAYNVNSLTDDCYPNTLCLINKFDIRDEKQLSAIEADITFAKSSEWERNPLSESFDFNHYKTIHKFFLKIYMLRLANCEVLISPRKELHFAVQIILKKCVKKVLTILNQDICL